MKEKTYVEDVDRNMYDFRNDEKDAYRIKNGLTEDIVEKISEEKHDPEWMHDFRLNSLKIYHEMKVPDWGPSIEGLNMDNIATYVRANTKMKGELVRGSGGDQGHLRKAWDPAGGAHLSRRRRCPV